MAEAEQEVLARSYKFRLYPNRQQHETLNSWQRSCRHVQFLCVLQRRLARDKVITIQELYDRVQVPDEELARRTADPETWKKPTWAQQGRDITQLRQIDSYLRDVPADTMSAIVGRVDEAYKRFFQAIKQLQAAPGTSVVVPTVRWAERWEHVGLEFRGAGRGTTLTPISPRAALVKLSGAGKLGYLRMRYHRNIPAGAEVKQAHVTRGADGWYISFSCVIPKPAPAPRARRQVNGVDLGCVHTGDKQRIAAIDDGRVYTATDQLRRNARRLGALQKLVSNRTTRPGAKCADPKSKRTQRRRQRIARLHQRVARQRDHLLQYIGRRLVDTSDKIAFEDVNWLMLRRKGKPMKKAEVAPVVKGQAPAPAAPVQRGKVGGRRRKRGLNRSMSTASPARLIALTREKAEVAGRLVVKVDARGTSQECSTCQGRSEVKKGLNVRLWTCEFCGAKHDRDVNAAINIARRSELPPDPVAAKEQRKAKHIILGQRKERRQDDIDVDDLMMVEEEPYARALL